MSMIRAVLFDVGGTLHEVHREPELEIAFCSELLEKLSSSGISLSVTPQDLLPLLHQNAENYKHWSEESRVELPASRIWSEYYLRQFHIGEDRLAPIAEELSVWYDSHRVRNVPRPHMQETIFRLRDMGLVQGIISNMISRTYVPGLMEQYGISECLSCVIVSASAGIRKPDPAIFQMAAGTCGVACGEMAYVGDTLSRDVLGCRNAGVALSIQIQNPDMAFRDAALVNTGLAPDVRISDLAEIPDIVRAYNARASAL